MGNRGLPAILAQKPANANGVAVKTAPAKIALAEDVAQLVSRLPHDVVGLLLQDSPTIQLAVVQIGQGPACHVLYVGVQIGTGRMHAIVRIDLAGEDVAVPIALASP